MKTNLMSIEGTKLKEISLPKCFSEKVREDVVQKAILAKTKKQPYSPSPSAGKNYSARGKMRHRRHVWQTHYGRGMSRVPRKVMSRRGTQFNWEAAGIPSTKGGPRAHPPKIISMINTKKINKKEITLALISAISATTSPKIISKRYKNLEEKDLKNFPIVVETKLSTLKTAPLKEAIKKILGETVYSFLQKRKTQRAGIGKLRGRRYKKNAGILIVLGKEEKLKTNLFEIKSADKLKLEDLAKGGLGRVVIYTESAIKELGEKIK